MPSSPIAEICLGCKRGVPWEWIPPIILGVRTLPGTGVWRTQTIDGTCYACLEAQEESERSAKRAAVIKLQLTKALGGEAFYESADFSQFIVVDANRSAFDKAKGFLPQWHNLYLWGACGVGKTTLASAIVRKHAEAEKTFVFLKPSQLMRKVRKKDPQEEQAVIDELARVEVFVLDELGIGNDTAFARQIFQEILDDRMGGRRNGLVVTSKYSLDGLAQKLEEDTIPSRLAGLCQVVEVGGHDHRIGSSNRLSTV